MKSLSRIGLGLSIVFGCLLVALVAELYYLLWWKRRFTNRRQIAKDDFSNPAKEFFYMLCVKRPPLRHNSSQEICPSSSVIITEALVNHEQQPHEVQGGKEFVFKPVGDGSTDDEVEAAELMMLNNLSGPPRFLFTITEETREDLESEEGRSRGRSLSDLLLTVETPYLTPIATSPLFFTPPLSPIDSNGGDIDHHDQAGSFSHLLETCTEAEFNKIRSSPPPKFKFLQDAEEKLHRRIILVEGGKTDGKSFQVKDYMDHDMESSSEQQQEGFFISIKVDNEKENDICGSSHLHHTQQQRQSSNLS
ncbi:hypothetical protein LINGRAHAP2_LOCUS1739 [Linum grandiflorum]